MCVVVVIYYVQGELVAVQNLNCKSLQITDGKLLVDLTEVDFSRGSMLT